MQEVVIMKRLAICLLILFVISGVLQAAPVSIPDPNLKKAIEKRLNKLNPDANDMLLLTYLTADSNGISDLTGIQHATNLQYLYLAYNNISDINHITPLKKLKYFSLYDNNVADVNALADVNQLEYLNLLYNDISDINSLANLKKLKYLYLSDNNDISNISALAGMSSLIDLRLAYNNISDISVLTGLPQIQQLRLRNNEIEDISPIAAYGNLTRLDLTNNPLNFDSWCPYLKQIIGNNPAANITSNPLINDRSTDMNNMRVFADKWLLYCSWSNSNCSGADFDESGKVDFYDFAIFADWWMYQP
jgi:Leucine-rich repeat (LRR) protein